MSTIERAAITATPDDIAAKLRHAPAWVRNGTAASRTREIAPSTSPVMPAKPQARAKAPVIGWLAGVCCPGVSKPCHSSLDGEMLREQLTPRAMASIAEQARCVKGDGIALTLGHGGPVLARTSGLDLLFSVNRILGLEFEARLRDTPEARKVLDSIGTDGLGVSIGYRKGSQWHVERDGLGRVRVIDDAILDHVAVIARDTGRSAAYNGARCFGIRSSGWGCPADLRQAAHAWAFHTVTRQAGAKP